MKLLFTEYILSAYTSIQRVGTYSYKGIIYSGNIQRTCTRVASHLFDRYILHRCEDPFPLSYVVGTEYYTFATNDVQSPHDRKKFDLGIFGNDPQVSQVTESAHVRLETFRAKVITARYQFFTARGNHAQTVACMRDEISWLCTGRT